MSPKDIVASIKRLAITTPLLVCTACGSTTQPSPPPLAGLTISPQGAAIVGVTTMSFEAARDSSPETTYSWNFGDGAAGSGMTATHVYNREGTFSVVLTATSRGASATASGTVNARTVTGLWRPDFFFAPCFSIRLTQAGSSIDAVAINGSAAAVTVQSPRDIVVTIAPTPVQNCGDAIQSRSGTFDATLDSFTIAIPPGQSDTWRRQ